MVLFGTAPENRSENRSGLVRLDNGKGGNGRKLPGSEEEKRKKIRSRDRRQRRGRERRKTLTKEREGGLLLSRGTGD